MSAEHRFDIEKQMGHLDTLAHVVACQLPNLRDDKPLLLMFFLRQLATKTAVRFVVLSIGVVVYMVCAAKVAPSDLNHPIFSLNLTTKRIVVTVDLTEHIPKCLMEGDDCVMAKHDPELAVICRSWYWSCSTKNRRESCSCTYVCL